MSRAGLAAIRAIDPKEDFALWTEHLKLRDFDHSDWRAVHRVLSNVQSLEFLLLEPQTQQQTKTYLAGAIALSRQTPRRAYELAVTLRDTEQVIGACSLHPTVDRCTSSEAELGYWIHPDFWSKGYVSEACRRLIEFGFSELGFHRITARCDPQNLASVRVLEKAGMVAEARIRDMAWAKGRWRDTTIYAILEQDWRQRP